MKNRLSFFALTFFLFLLPSACLAPAPVKEKPFFPHIENRQPGRVVIMPFLNRTEKKDIEVQVRKSFYNHFSSKNYHDIELYEIDRSIQSLEKLYARPWADIPVSELGRFFNADYILYGEVLTFRKIFLFFYSQMTLSLKVKMVHAQTGRTVFSETEVRSLYNGDLPLSLISLFSATVRSGLNLQEKRIINLSNKVSRAFAKKIPEPPVVPGDEYVNLQVASFSEKTRAIETVDRLKAQGVDVRMEAVVLKNRTWYRIVGGPYLKEKATEIKERITADKQFEPIVIYCSLTAGEK